MKNALFGIYMDTFSLNNKKVIMYGAAYTAARYFDFFIENNMEVIGFIDKRGREIKEFRDRPVWTLDNEEIGSLNKDDYIVFVAVKNVFDHTNIVRDLTKNGFYNLIYRPQSVVNGKEDEKTSSVNLAYSAIEYRNIGEMPANIYKTYSADEFIASDRAILFSDDNSVTALIPIELIHTDDNDEGDQWENIPVMQLIPHIDLFRFIGGDTRSNPERYIEYCVRATNDYDGLTVTEAWKENVIKNRAMIYEHMAHSMETEADFFLRNAPRVKYSNKGYFNLCSGKHRAAFYAAVKRKYMPTRMEREEYEKYIGLKQLDSGIQRLKEVLPDELAAPISHPYFYDYPCNNKEFYYNFLYLITYLIADDSYSRYGCIQNTKCSVLCKLNDLGFIERSLQSMSIKVDCEHGDDIQTAIDELLGWYNTFDECIQNMEKRYDYLLLDSLSFGVESYRNMSKACKTIAFVEHVEWGIPKEICEEYSYSLLFNSVLNGKMTDVVLLERREEG